MLDTNKKNETAIDYSLEDSIIMVAVSIKF